MKKKLICFVMAMMLILSSSVTVFASQLNTNNNVSQNMPDIDLGPTGSLQFMFAKLQLAQAEISKQQATDLMVQIEEVQKEQKQVAEFLNTARQCWSEAESTGAVTEMPADMAEYMDANGLSYDTTGDDLLMTAEEWDVAIASLEHHQERLGMKTQTQMIYVQDLMAQYSSYLEGAATQIPSSQNPNASQTLRSIAKGQSMYGDSEVGLAVTGLVLGLVLGCAATLAVQKVRRKKDAV